MARSLQSTRHTWKRHSSGQSFASCAKSLVTRTHVRTGFDQTVCGRQEWIRGFSVRRVRGAEVCHGGTAAENSELDHGAA